MSCIYNSNESIENQLRNALGLNESECIIESGGGAYTVKPIIEKNELQINIIKNINDNNGFTIHPFQLCNLFFENCVFGCVIEILILESKPINNKIHFIKCVFQKSFRCTEIIFDKTITFDSSKFEDNIFFIRSNFNKTVDFVKCTIHNEADFSGSIFLEKANFKQTIFKASAYFDKTTFKDIVIFRRSEFCKNAHFYQTNFNKNKNPDFFQAIFNEHLNLTDTKIFHFDFEYFKTNVQTCSQADEYRNIFKTFKNSLIKSGNLLGASRFHKMELYCKELELEYKKKEEPQNSTTRDFIDRIQLYCYRITSDHHTDLALILNNIIFLIALFGIIQVGLAVYENINVGNIVARISETTISSILVSSTIFIALIICFMFVCRKKIASYVVLIGICVSIVCTFFPALTFVLASICCIVFLLLVLIACILHCYYKMYVLEIKQYVFIFSYPIVTIMLVFNPKQLMPILGKLIDNQETECCCYVDDFNIFELFLNTTYTASETLNLIYMLFLFLLLFSLQKTARKNTIVPS